MTPGHLRGAVEYVTGAVEETGVQLVSVHIGLEVSIQVRYLDEVDSLADHLDLGVTDRTVPTLYMRAGRHLTYRRVEVYTGTKNTRPQEATP